MKKVILILAAALIPFMANAQTDVQDAAAQAAAALASTPESKKPEPKPVYWTHSILTQFNLDQSTFTNWAKGGLNTVSLSGYVDANADYEREKLVWKNRLQLDYGLSYSEDKPIIQKNRDRILFESTFGYKASQKLSYSASFTFLNQFTNGYEYGTPSTPDDAPDNWKPKAADWRAARVLKSSMFAPANITLGLGVEWAPNDLLTFNIAPVTGGFTIVANEKLRLNYGMELREGHTEDEIQKDDNGLLLNGNIFRPARFEFGAQIKATAKVKVNENFDASSQLILFSNYLKKPENIRVNWDNRVMWKLTKFFSLNLSTSLIYDDTVLITDEKHPDGRKVIQFTEALQFGFTYTFTSKKD